MLKNTDRYKKDNDVHFASSQTKKKKKNSSYKDITIFISVFLIGLLIILGFAKILSPNVDVEIADNDEYSEFEDDSFQGTIDERLKHLKMEDENGTADNKIFSPELDEKVVIPSQTKKAEEEPELKAQDIKTPEEKETKHHTPTTKTEDKKTEATPTASPVPTTHNTTYRVVVGQYASEKQAEVAKSIILDAGSGVTPIVKNIGGSYTLQVGVFTSREKAQQMANNLLKSNFPARVIE